MKIAIRPREWKWRDWNQPCTWHRRRRERLRLHKLIVQAVAVYAAGACWRRSDPRRRGGAHVRRERARARRAIRGRRGVHDPWRFQAPALELERDGLPIVAFPQSPARLIPASDRLYRAVIEKRLTHPSDPALNAHVSNAIAKNTPRGWRIDKPHGHANIDALIALAMAVERADVKPEPVRLLGWRPLVVPK